MEFILPLLAALLTVAGTSFVSIQQRRSQHLQNKFDELLNHLAVYWVSLGRRFDSLKICADMQKHRLRILQELEDAKKESKAPDKELNPEYSSRILNKAESLQYRIHDRLSIYHIDFEKSQQVMDMAKSYFPEIEPQIVKFIESTIVATFVIEQDLNDPVKKELANKSYEDSVTHREELISSIILMRDKLTEVGVIEYYTKQLNDFYRP